MHASLILQNLFTEQWKQLADFHALLTKQINATAIEMAHFSVKTPCVLLLSVTGINVVSAGELAGEAGPIEHYASPTALNGRDGLYPARYKSDEVDRNDNVAKQCNRRLRAACILVAKKADQVPSLLSWLGRRLVKAWCCNRRPAMQDGEPR